MQPLKMTAKTVSIRKSTIHKECSKREYLDDALRKLRFARNIHVAFVDIVRKQELKLTRYVDVSQYTQEENLNTAKRKIICYRNQVIWDIFLFSNLMTNFVILFEI